MKTLRGDHFTLEPVQVDHAHDIYGYGRTTAFAKALTAEPYTDVSQALAFVQMLIHANAVGERMYWAVRCGDRIMGTLGFIFHGLRAYREAEFGYGFSPAVWGNGLAHKAATLALDYGAKELGLERFRFYTRATNAAAIRGAEKLGFVKDGVMVRFYANGDGCQVLRKVVLK